jgi:hypothetical protein
MGFNGPTNISKFMTPASKMWDYHPGKGWVNGLILEPIRDDQFLSREDMKSVILGHLAIARGRNLKKPASFTSVSMRFETQKTPFDFSTLMRASARLSHVAADVQKSFTHVTAIFDEPSVPTKSTIKFRPIGTSKPRS